MAVTNITHMPLKDMDFSYGTPTHFGFAGKLFRLGVGVLCPAIAPFDGYYTLFTPFVLYYALLHFILLNYITQIHDISFHSFGSSPVPNDLGTNELI